MSTRIAIVTGDSLTDRMAGPAIRAWEMAKLLSIEHEVSLISTTRAELTHPAFDVRFATRDEVVALVLTHDVLVFQGHLLYEHPALADADLVVVADIYDPFHLEQLEQARDLADEARRAETSSSTDSINHQMRRGDFFLCASTKQRDFWLGHLASLGRINPANYDADPTLRRLIDVSPFGVAGEPPVRTKPALRGVVPGIAADDEVVLWGGGIYNWFDPLTLIRAVDKLRSRRPKVRLHFLGAQHPNPHVPEMRMAVEARALAGQLGILGTHVFFNETWVPYDERQNFLLDADIGVSTHFDHVETEFSFRTRLLDYMWTSLPIVTTEGDSLAALVEARRLGLTVPPEDIDALEAALFRLLEDRTFHANCRANAPAVANELRWPAALAPLVAFCRAPARAPDLLDEAYRFRHRPGWAARGGVFQDARIVRSLLSEGGPSLVVRKAIARVRRVRRAG